MFEIDFFFRSTGESGPRNTFLSPQIGIRGNIRRFKDIKNYEEPFLPKEKKKKKKKKKN